MENKLALTMAVFFIILVPMVSASPEAIFQWEDRNIEEGETAYIEFYQNFEMPYNFTIISDIIDECWVVKDYYDENKVVCRNDNGLCKSIQQIDKKYVRCSVDEVKKSYEGEKAILFYEYEDEWGRQNGVYQTKELEIKDWSAGITNTGPFMIAIIASLVVIVIILDIIYFAGSNIATWIKDMGNSNVDTYQELKDVKSRIGKKGEVFTNCTVIY